MSLLELYGIFLLINLKEVAGGALVLGIPLLAAYAGLRFLDNKPIAVPKWLIAAALSAGFLVTAIPSEKQMMMIAGGYFISNIDGIEKVPPNLVKALNKLAEDFIQTTEKPKK